MTDMSEKKTEISSLKTTRERLKYLINSGNFDKEDFEKKTGIKISTFNNYIYYDKKPPVDSLVKIADYFKTSTDFLCAYTNFLLDPLESDFTLEFSEYIYEKLIANFRSFGSKISKVITKDNFHLFYHLITREELLESDIINSSDHEVERIIEIEKVLEELHEHSIRLFLDNRKDEVEAMAVRAKQTVNYESSFKSLDVIAENTGLSKEDKIVLIKSILEKNQRETNKAIRMLNELLED